MTVLMTMTTSVRKATRDDVPLLALALARAFDTDPPMRWFLRDDARRVEQARDMFDVMLRTVHLARDACYTTESVVGGALWVPPGRWQLGFVQQLRLLPGMIRVFGRDLPRAQRGLAAMDSGHPRRPHWRACFDGTRCFASPVGVSSWETEDRDAAKNRRSHD